MVAAQSEPQAAKKPFGNLEFVRVTEPGVFKMIPRQLFEQIKDRDFEVDRLYQLAPAIVKDGLSQIYVLTDENSIIKGVLWAYVNVLTRTIEVPVLTVDREYQFSDAITKSLEYIRSWSKETFRIQCTTTRPKAYEKLGWKRTKSVILEMPSEDAPKEMPENKEEDS